MKNRIVIRMALALIFLYLLPFKAESQSTILESQSFDSQILNEKVNYSVYLPSDYERSDRKYPVLYLLHGGGGNETDWFIRGNMQHIVDKAIEEGDLPHTIVIMPSSLGSHYINNYDNSVLYEDMFIKELIPYVESTYRTRTDRDSRSIAGLSRGGFGSLIFAMKYPEMFKVCVAMSSATRTDEEYENLPVEEWSRKYKAVFGELQGKSRLNDTWKNNNPIHLAANRPVDSLKMVNYLIDCGDDDFLINGNMELHKVMKEKGIPHEFRVKDGGHTWTYWRNGLESGLEFIGFYIMGGWGAIIK